MKSARAVVVIAIVACSAICFPAPLRAQAGSPATRKSPVTDVYFGTPVIDNYRWLEDLKDPDVLSWLKAQPEHAAKVVAAIPGRDSLFEDLVRLEAMKPAAVSEVSRKGGRWFFKRTLPNHDVGQLYYREGIDSEEILLFDPAKDAPRGASLVFYNVSEDGKRVELGIAEDGSESSTIRIMNVDDRSFYPDSISPCWLDPDGSWLENGGWNPDGTGFTYNRLNSNDVHDKSRMLNTTSYYHVVGTDASKDVAILSSARYPELGIQPEDTPHVVFSDDSQYLFGNAETVRNELTVFVAPASELLAPTIHWKPLLKPEDEVVSFETHGDTLFLLSHKDAPRYRILATRVSHPDVEGAREIRPQGPEIIKHLDRTRDYLLATMSDGINDRLERYECATSRWGEVRLPSTGSIEAAGFGSKWNDAQVVIHSWTRPPERCQLDAAVGAITPGPWSGALHYPGVDDIVAEEVEAPAPDGTLIPLSIVYNRNVVRDGNANCWLWGYGAYGVSSTPEFSTLGLALINRGVVVACAHVRGGGEKGIGWYRAGFKGTKPNTWKDFIACAEYLGHHHYTSPQRLFGVGTSAGGIMIGRAITDRPDLFGAAICNVPSVNALRLENAPNGPSNTPEFGAVKDSLECRALLEMDAYQHVKNGVRYPAVMCVGGFNDPRTIVWQPAKFAAALQNSTTSGKPVLLQVNYDSGHSTEDEQVEFRSVANMFAFCLWQTGHPDFQPHVPTPRR